MTLKLAIYFIVPAAMVFVVASICAPALRLAAHVLLKREMSQDEAAKLMGCSIVPSAGWATMLYWLDAGFWSSYLNGVIAFFLLGTVVFANGIKETSPDNRKPPSAIGLRHGAMLSAVLTSGVLVSSLVVFLLYHVAT